MSQAEDEGFTRVVVPMCFYTYGQPPKLTWWQRFKAAARAYVTPMPPLRCRLGFHAWLRYDLTYTRESIETGPVERWRVCPLCKTSQRNIDHDWRST